MERKIKILIEYLYAFNETMTRAEIQKIFKRLKECGVKTITCYGKDYELTTDFIKSIKGVC